MSDLRSVAVKFRGKEIPFVFDDGRPRAYVLTPMLSKIIEAERRRAQSRADRLRALRGNR